MIRGALARDAILAAYRVSEPPGNGRLTLCRISHLLEDANVRNRLCEQEWHRQQGCPDFLVDYEASQQPSRIVFIRNHVPPKWTKVKPAEPRLYELRTKFEKIRNNILAHAGDTSTIGHPMVNEIREFIDLTAKLVEQAVLLFCGSAAESGSSFKIFLDAANEFWNYAQEGPIRAYRQHMEQRRLHGID